LLHTVIAASGSAAASAIEKPFGTGKQCSAGTTTYSAYPPPCVSEHTASPAFHAFTPSPNAAISPATSSPSTGEASAGGGYFPARCSKSARFTPAARTRINTSPAPASGRAPCTTFITSGPPGASIPIIRIVSAISPHFPRRHHTAGPLLLILKTTPPLRSNLISARNKPKLGQNFLVSPTACHAIVDALGNLAHRTVIEIGPGKAAITDLLAPRAGRLIAIELDRELAPRLRERFASQSHVEIIESDVLDVNLSALAKPGEKLLVVGNLPYYLTSDILLHLAAHEAAIDRAVLMVQREVADRVAAQPGSRDYGLLSITVQLHGDVEKILTLPPGAFSPPPEVHSTVLRWTFNPKYTQLGVEPAPFTAFLRHCFAQKRKTLANNLRAAGWQPIEITPALAAAGIAPTARAEALTAAELAAVFQHLPNPGNHPH
jgi:16S rRNA (adenine1518-N6/adenine1519-N6)-dimethyltransferase